MYRKANVLFLMNQTPMHAGSGDSLGIVDMPIQRERHTSFPKIEASSLKGSMREHFERIFGEKHEKIKASFGYEGQSDTGSKAGALGFTDARLLLFPVKSMKGVFAWITCPKIISKFNDELELVDIKQSFNITDGNVVAKKDNLTLNGNSIVLEEYTFDVKEDDKVKEFGEFLAEKIFGKDDKSYFAEKLRKDIVVLEDDDFKDFVILSTEVITRTKINNETGTVQDGALFTEEYLPAESIMYSLVLTAPEFAKKEDKKEFDTEEKLKTFFKDFITEHEVLQIGGNATLGKGITKAKFVEPKNEGGAK